MRRAAWCCQLQQTEGRRSNLLLVAIYYFVLKRVNMYVWAISMAIFISMIEYQGSMCASVPVGIPVIFPDCTYRQRITKARAVAACNRRRFVGKVATRTW